MIQVIEILAEKAEANPLREILHPRVPRPSRDKEELKCHVLLKLAGLKNR
jgi:hypothetical protein